MTWLASAHEPTPVALPLATDGGCALSQAGVHHALMTDPTLRALDLRDCPDLEVVDLRASTQPELHLSVIGCPRLRQILLPDHSRAFLHIDTGKQKPALQVFGGVAQIDAAWRSGRFEKQAAEGTAWSFVAVGTLEQVQGWHCPDQGLGLWALIETPDLPILDLHPPASVSEVLLPPSNSLQHLRWWGSALGSLDIREATALTHIDVFSGCALIMLSACPALATIEGPVSPSQNARLSMHQKSGAAKRLHLNMRFSEVTLVDSDVIRLVMFTPQVLRLLRCHSLYKIKLSPNCNVECEGYTPASLRDVATAVLDEGTVLHALERMKSGDPEAWPQLRAMLPMASSARLVPRMLKGLKSAMDLDVDMQEIWETRLELYARHIFPRLKPNQKASHQQLLRGQQEWCWTLASDLGHDGWRADWQIWQRGGEAQVKDLEKMLPHMVDGLMENRQATEALVPWLLRGEPGQCLFLSAVFEKMAQTTRFRDSEGHFQRTAQLAAMPSQNTPERIALAKSARQYLCKTLDLEELIYVLERWLQHDPVNTRVLLVQLAAKPPRTRFVHKFRPRFQQLVNMLLLGGRLPEQRPPI